MQKCILRHKERSDHNQILRKLSRLIISIIKHRKQWSHNKHHNRHTGTAHHRKRDHLVIRISRLLHISCTQKLSHNNRNRISQCNKYDIKHIIDRIGNIQRSNHIQSTHRITLCQHCHRGCP